MPLDYKISVSYSSSKLQWIKEDWQQWAIREVKIEDLWSRDPQSF